LAQVALQEISVVVVQSALLELVCLLRVVDHKMPLLILGFMALLLVVVVVVLVHQPPQNFFMGTTVEQVLLVGQEAEVALVALEFLQQQTMVVLVE
jgi:hypothetical protein